MIGWILFGAVVVVLVLVGYFHNKLRVEHKTVVAALEDIVEWCEEVDDPDLVPVLKARGLQGLHDRN